MLIETLAAAVMPVSITKVLLSAALLFLWASWATIVDKDAEYFQQNRKLWNLAHIGAAAIGFLALFLIPLFIVGYILAILLTIGTGFAYAKTRNAALPEKFRWKLNAETLTRMLEQRKAEKAQKSASIRFKSAKGAQADLKPVPMHDEPLYDTHVQVEDILIAALARHAQGLVISGGEGGFQVALQIDGMEYKLEDQLETEVGLQVIDYLKMHCAMDVSERRKKLSGACGIDTEEHGTHQIKVLTAGSRRGIQCNVVIDAVKQVSIPLDDLGLLESQMQMLEPVLEDGRGVVIIATPPGQGRTTTLYSLVANHDPYTQDIHIFEPESERELESITVHHCQPAETGDRLRSLLLRDPHVVMVASVTDQPTAQQVSEAGKEGRRIYAGLRADDTFTALKLWMKAVGDKDLVADSLVAIVSQRLVRKLCNFCRQKYKPDAAALKKLNLPADRIKELYKAGGQVVVKNEPETCPACHGVGYMGLEAAFEVMVLDEEAREMVRKADLQALRTHIRRKKTQWLEEAALNKVVAGSTSIGEAMRAMGHDKKEKE